MMDIVQIRHGRLDRVYGCPVKAEGVTICPADLHLCKEPVRSRDTRFYLADFERRTTTDALENAIRYGFDVCWTYARLPRVYFIEPCAGEFGALLAQGFVAVAEGSAEGYAFQCTDFIGRSYLQFSGDEPNVERCRRIATAFWCVLLNAPDDLRDFHVQQLGAVEDWGLEFPVELEFGCKFGHLYRDELHK